MDTGVEFAQELLAFADAVIGSDSSTLNTSRSTLEQAMGKEALVSAATTAAAFSLVDRAANGIGIFVEPMIMAPSEDFREQLGINKFPSAANTLKRS